MCRVVGRGEGSDVKAVGGGEHLALEKVRCKHLENERRVLAVGAVAVHGRAHECVGRDAEL